MDEVINKTKRELTRRYSRNLQRKSSCLSISWRPTQPSQGQRMEASMVA